MSACDVFGCKACREGASDNCLECFVGYAERFRRRAEDGLIVRYCEAEWTDEQVYSFAILFTVALAVLLGLGFWMVLRKVHPDKPKVE